MLPRLSPWLVFLPCNTVPRLLQRSRDDIERGQSVERVRSQGSRSHHDARLRGVKWTGSPCVRQAFRTVPAQAVLAVLATTRKEGLAEACGNRTRFQIPRRTSRSSRATTWARSFRLELGGLGGSSVGWY